MKEHKKTIRHPFILYLVGTSGSGKSTIANALAVALKKNGVHPFQVIDGDVIRHQFGDIFGYTYEERMKCNKAVSVVVQYLLENGVSVILSQVAAYEAMRTRMREQFGEAYIEIYVKCSFEECVRRDVKGYYERLQSGDMENLNGASDIFEAPERSHLVIDTEQKKVEEAVKMIIICLNKQGKIAL